MFSKRIVFIKIAALVTFSLNNKTTIAQQGKDTAYVISSTDKQYPSSSLSLANNSYFDLINPNREGVRPVLFYNRNDWFFVGVNYNHLSTKWRPDSTGQRHRLFTNYSVSQKAFSLGYQGIYHKVFHSWTAFIDVNYDWIRWINFYGLGNETLQETVDRNYYRMRRREGVVSVNMRKKIGKQSFLTLRPYYQYVQVLNDRGRFLSERIPGKFHPDQYDANRFGGIRADLQLQWLDDVVLPRKGFVLSGGVNHQQNLDKAESFTNYQIYSRVYFSFLKKVCPVC